MKRIFKTLVSLLVVAVVALSVFSINTFAANTVLSFSKKELKVGETLTVSVRLSISNMYGSDITVEYDENVLTYVSGADSGGAGQAHIVDENVGGQNQKTYSLTFKAAKAGSCVIKAAGTVGAGVPSTDVKIDGASASVTVKNAALSSNANLKSLTVSNGSLSPKFSASTTSYKVSVKKTVTSCKIYATAADSGAKVAISGTSELKVGDNTRTVTVTAPSGAQKVYTITVNRSDVDEPVASETSSGTENDSLETIIEGVPYMIVADISAITLPTGFKAVEKTYNDQQITVAADSKNNYEIYYLKTASDEEPAPYTYDEEANTFTILRIIHQGENQYIVADFPDDLIPTTDYYLTNEVIDDQNIKCYASNDTKLAGMYYIYCYFSGRFSVYRYDSLEKVLQRNPEFSVFKQAAVTTDDTESGFTQRFANLSSNAKTILVCIILVIIGIIALIVMLIIKFLRRDRYEDYYDKDDDFDNINIADSFIVDPSDEDK